LVGGVRLGRGHGAATRKGVIPGHVLLPRSLGVGLRVTVGTSR
jgi:hypothetical protein